MKIKKIGVPSIVMSNPNSKHCYFGWPTVARLQNGKIAVVASGFRLRHVCPFGKTVISYSEDEGQTYTAPAPIIDTVLDDRDGGILAYGERSVIVTSFNNTVEFQREEKSNQSYENAYLDTVTPEEEAKALGVTFRISHDCGMTFGPIQKSPVTSPHGPTELPDGSLLWVGRVFSPKNAKVNGVDCIQAHKIHEDGTMEYVGEIDNIVVDGEELLSCEPHAILLKDGRILAHIRVQRAEKKGILTIYQSESADLGKTWSKPRQILEETGGAPSHLFRHSSGILICTYGHRKQPYGVRAMFSNDEGETWDTDYELFEGVSADLGYPSTAELSDGSLLTVFYAKESQESPCIILQQQWRIEL